MRLINRVVFVGGSRGTPPSLDLTFPPIGLSENLGGMERERGGKGEREGWGDHLRYSPPTGFCLKYHHAYKDIHVVSMKKKRPFLLYFFFFFCEDGCPVVRVNTPGLLQQSHVWYC